MDMVASSDDPLGNLAYAPTSTASAGFTFAPEIGAGSFAVTLGRESPAEPDAEPEAADPSETVGI